MKDLYRYILGVLLLLMSVNGMAENHYWLTYTKQGQIGNNWQWNTRLGMRHYSPIQADVRYGLSPSISGRYNKISWMLATRFFYYDQKASEDYIETRPWLGLSYKHSPMFSQNVKWEHRTFNNDMFSTNRVRYSLKWNIKLLNQGNKTLKFGFTPEALWDLNLESGERLNAIRWIVPITYKTDKNWQLQLAPFVQTDGFDMAMNEEEYLWVLRLNINTF